MFEDAREFAEDGARAAPRRTLAMGADGRVEPEFADAVDAGASGGAPAPRPDAPASSFTALDAHDQDRPSEVDAARNDPAATGSGAFRGRRERRDACVDLGEAASPSPDPETAPDTPPPPGAGGFRVLGGAAARARAGLRTAEAVFFGDEGAQPLRRWARRRRVSEPMRAAARRLGPVLAGVAVGAGLAAWPSARGVLIDSYERARSAVLARPEYAIRQVEVIGAQRLSDAEIVKALNVRPDNRAALAFNYKEARARLEGLGWVKRASVTLKPPQTLAVTVEERTPAVVWRSPDQLLLLDPTGVEIAPTPARSDFPDLPLIVGPGADAAAEEALTLAGKARAGGLPLAALTRVGRRRWDVELVGGPRVMLPEDDPESALGRAVRWAENADLLARGFDVVDLRIPFAPAARPAAAFETADIPPE